MFRIIQVAERDLEPGHFLERVLLSLLRVSVNQQEDRACNNSGTGPACSSMMNGKPTGIELAGWVSGYLELRSWPNGANQQMIREARMLRRGLIISFGFLRDRLSSVGSGLIHCARIRNMCTTVNGRSDQRLNDYYCSYLPIFAYLGQPKLS